jgi:hypothetical protein
MALLKEVGFVQVEYVRATGVATSNFTVGALFRARTHSEEGFVFTRV